MSRIIRISDEVFKGLQDVAREEGMQFVSPDNVLRHVLKLPQTRYKSTRHEIPKGGDGLK